MEKWKDINGYEGLYKVSNKGRVKSLNYNHTKKEKILKPYINNCGYEIVCLSKNNTRKQYLIHRLVAEAFIPNPNNYSEVNHINEDKLNNYVNNLEWCNKKYNMNYGSRSERASKKISNTMKGNRNATRRKVKCITTGEIFNCIKEASEKYNINRGNICSCCKGKLKFAGKHPITKEKLVWEYV